MKPVTSADITERKKENTVENNNDKIMEIVEDDQWRSDEWTELLKAVLKAQAATPIVKQDGANPFHRSKYATLAASWTSCRQPLNDNDLVLMHRMGIHPNGYDYLTTILAHSKSGQWVSSTYRLLLKDQTAQGQGSAITYGR